MKKMRESSLKTRKLQPICITLLMIATLIITASFVPQSKAQSTQTLQYDNGEGSGITSGFIYGVKFSLPAGVSSANILTVRYAWYALGGALDIHITGPDHTEELTDPISTTAAVDGTAGPLVWNEVDVSNKSIVVSGDFYVAVKKTGEGTTGGIFMDNSTDGVRSFYGPNMLNLITPVTFNFMIRVVIQPLTPTPTPTATATPTPSPTSTPTPTPTPTQTPSPTLNPTPTTTPNPTPAPTLNPTSTTTSTPDPTSTSDPSPSSAVPEFPQTIMLLVVGAMFLVVTVGLVAYRRRNTHSLATLK
jgi:hypothetical protein